ncbi:translation initiation factor eIF-2B epsilon subunit, GEF [Elasticomyces elasticus]|nr:translation initiation factor eIF-2B epsilon subunit, GEF [Elasticomyces elasticus]
MRDLDKRSILTGDFLVVYGDIVSNMPLGAALAAHRERRAKDKNAIMTMVLREAGDKHRSKTQGASPVFVIDPTKDRCLHYEQIRPRQSNHFLNLDPDILKHDDLEIRQDLIDCGIDICTPDVLALWSDNFDYEAPRKGFLHSVLKDYELNGKTIHTYVVDECYAARVKNLNAYDSISKDLISRWAYPLCPDSNLLKDQTYRLQKGNVYKEEGVILARSCTINHRTVIGKGTAVGDGSVVSNSIIGRRCLIGRNVTIDGAYIWDDAVVGDGSTVKDAIIANEAIVGKRCQVLPGALLSYNVRIVDGTTVQGTARVTRFKRKRGYDRDEVAKGASDPKVVGEGGDGFQMEKEEDQEDDNMAGLGTSGLLYNMGNLSLSSDSISTLKSDLSEEHTGSHDHYRASSFASVTSDDSQPSRGATEFHHDAAAGIYDSLQRGDATDNIQLEFNSLRMSANASEHQQRRAVVAAFMKRISALIESGSAIPEAVKQTIPVHRTLIERVIFDKSREAKDDQVDLLLLIQADLVHRNAGDSILVFVCNSLTLSDVIEDRGFEQWWNNERSVQGEEMAKVRAKTQQFIDVLLADEESGSEEESEEGEQSNDDDDDQDE